MGLLTWKRLRAREAAAAKAVAASLPMRQEIEGPMPKRRGRPAKAEPGKLDDLDSGE